MHICLNFHKFWTVSHRKAFLVPIHRFLHMKIPLKMINLREIVKSCAVQSNNTVNDCCWSTGVKAIPVKQNSQASDVTSGRYVFIKWETSHITIWPPGVRAFLFQYKHHYIIALKKRIIFCLHPNSIELRTMTCSWLSYFTESWCATLLVMDSLNTIDALTIQDIGTVIIVLHFFVQFLGNSVSQKGDCIKASELSYWWAYRNELIWST